MNGDVFGVVAVFVVAVTVLFAAVAAGAFVYARKTDHRRVARFYAARTRALADAGLAVVEHDGRFGWREQSGALPAVDVGFHDKALSCRLPAPELGARVAACWARRGGVGVLPRSAGVVLDDKDANACVGRVVDDGLSFHFDGREFVVEAAAAAGDLEPQVVQLIARARALSAALTKASSSLPALSPASRAAALLET